MSLALLEKSGTQAELPRWPRLEALRLGPEALEWRRSGIGGSDANAILSGDPDRIRELWLEKRGESEPADLSGHLPAMLGCWTEPFNRMWYERVTGNSVSRAGEWIQCARHDWRRCTLDGFVADAGAVWEPSTQRLCFARRAA